MPAVAMERPIATGAAPTRLALPYATGAALRQWRCPMPMALPYAAGPGPGPVSGSLVSFNRRSTKQDLLCRIPGMR